MNSYSLATRKTHNRIIKSVFYGFISIITLVLMIYLSQTTAQAHQSSYIISEEELIAATNKSAGVADIIMNASDFLNDGERPADYSNIHEYIDELNIESINQINNDTDCIITEPADNSDNADEFVEAISDIDEIDDVLNDESDSEEDIDEKLLDKDEVDTDDWRLILVNKQNPVPDDYDANLANINSSLLADERIIDSIYEMMNDASEDGVNLMICSAYRSYDRQTTLFNNKMNKLMRLGMSYMDAYAVGSMSVTVPGTSEHQIGLALDILTPSYTEMDDGFGETEAGIWLAENAVNYGFILRYPKGKEEITGIIYEPWHFRYVGREYSYDITEKGVTLEEYVNGEY